MEATSEIKQRLSIEDVVGDYVELKRSGRNLKGLCPFHSENTPSFTVNPEKGIYHCFGCGEGGDHFEFVMKMDGLDFREALEKLASKAGLDLSQYSSGSAELSKLKNRLREAHELAARYYQKSLIENQTALEYVTKKRNFNKHTIGDFQIGYAPKQGKALLNFLKKRGFSEKELEQGGLIANRRGEFYDMFFARILVVLSDTSGKPIGFTGRVLDDGLPKYLNTSKTVLYDKSRHVFGLAQAKDSIREKDQAVLVEGNFDVLSSHQVNVKNVVATAGTAVTEMQLKQISKFSSNIAFAFDQDQAGLAATMRAIPIAQKAEVNLSIIDVSAGKDPDELIQRDPRAWQKLVENPVYVIDWLFAKLEQQFDLKTASGKSSFSSRMLAVLSQLKDPVEQEHYLKQLAEKTDVSLDAVQRKMTNQDSVNYSKRPTKAAAFHVEQIDNRRISEDNLLSIFFNNKEAIQELAIPKEIFTDERAEIYSGDKLPSKDKYANIYEQLYGDWTSHQIEHEAQGLVRELLKKQKDKEMLEITSAIAEAEARGDQEEIIRLLRQHETLSKR